MARCMIRKKEMVYLVKLFVWISHLIRIGTDDCNLNKSHMNKSFGETRVNTAGLISVLPHQWRPTQKLLGYVWPCLLSPDVILTLACWWLPSLTLDVPHPYRLVWVCRLLANPGYLYQTSSAGLKTGISNFGECGYDKNKKILRILRQW